MEEISGVVKSLKVRIDRNPNLFRDELGENVIDEDEKFKFNGIDIIANKFHAVVM